MRHDLLCADEADNEATDVQIKVTEQKIKGTQADLTPCYLSVRFSKNQQSTNQTSSSRCSLAELGMLVEGLEDEKVSEVSACRTISHAQLGAKVIDIAEQSLSTHHFLVCAPCV